MNVMCWNDAGRLRVTRVLLTISSIQFVITVLYITVHCSDSVIARYNFVI